MRKNSIRAHSPPVKICIQHSGTRKFLRGIDTWVDGRAGARHFGNSMDAFRHCVEHGLAAVNIVVDYGTDRVPLIIPVTTETPVPDARQPQTA
jgi:hypothetical protein